MDYRQKMVVPSSQKYKHEDDDDDDLEALRLAALKSLKAKTANSKIKGTSLIQKPALPQTQPPFSPYSSQRNVAGKREYFYPNRPLRQNWNVYYPSRNNQNLIEIIPVEESDNTLQNDPDEKIPEGDILTDAKDGSKFHRYTDNASGSEDEDGRDQKDLNDLKLHNKVEDDNNDDLGTDKENQSGIDETSPCVEETEGVAEEDADEEEEEDEDKDDDDGDVLLMADLEEEDSLERLMDEMEREMTEDKPISEKKEKKCSKKDNNKESKKSHESSKLRANKLRERANDKVENSSMGSYKNDRRLVSPYGTNKILNKHRSVSPKLKSRKKSPRRSPQSRRTPPPISRPTKKSQRDQRLRSPRKTSPKFSPRPRSPKLSPRSRSPKISPRRTPVRSPIRRSPQHKLSPRGRSQSRSPLRRRSRSPPCILSRSRSPRVIRLRSPRSSPSRISPRSRSPLSRSPKISPHRLSPRSRSPKLSPRQSPPLLSRTRSPKISSPRRTSPRARTPPRQSPHKSPKNSPRLSPRRRRLSPKELSKKNRVHSTTPEDIVSVVSHKKENTPIRRNIPSPELIRNKTKISSFNKESLEVTNDPVLEARRRKFESTRLIDPIHDNKKIKLSRKESVNITSKSSEILENVQDINSPQITHEMSEDDYELPETELCLHDSYDFDELAEHSDDSALPSAVTICVEEPPIEKERVKKKKKKKDKQLYQVGKIKSGELPLSERISKEKKCKKRKDIISENMKDEIDTVVDESVDDEADLRTELSRRRAERLNRTAPIQSARLLQSAFKGVVNEVVKNNAKVIQRHLAKNEDKSNSKDIRRVTVLHRAMPDLDNSEDETIDSKVPIRFRLGMNKSTQETRESKSSRKSSKRQGRKGTKKNTH